MRRSGKTVQVTGPNQQSVAVKFFDDGSIRFRLNKAGPMVMQYAFLPGKELNVIVELKPSPGSPWLQI